MDSDYVEQMWANYLDKSPALQEVEAERGLQKPGSIGYRMCSEYIEKRLKETKE